VTTATSAESGQSALLAGKNAIIYGAGGLGGGIARAFAREGASVFLASRTRQPLEALVAEIDAAGGSAEATVLDALDDGAVDRHVDDVIARAGSVDVSFNLTSREDKQGRPIIDMSLEDMTRGPATALTSQFVTARAAARHMIEQGSGVILSLTSGTARAPSAGMGNTAAADAAVELLMRTLALEVGPRGVRVVGLYTAAVAETLTRERVAAITGQDIDPAVILSSVAGSTTLRRPPGLERVADTAAFLASDRAGDITGTIVNVTCGLVPG
jgi:NAD(P)-dependent dehydrogenase (short-subunit alcohol dehydrogenase family)